MVSRRVPLTVLVCDFQAEFFQICPVGIARGAGKLQVGSEARRTSLDVGCLVPWTLAEGPFGRGGLQRLGC